jgi:hypothetical protein
VSDPTPEPAARADPAWVEDHCRREIAEWQASIKRIERAIRDESDWSKRAALYRRIEEHRGQIDSNNLTMSAYGIDPNAAPPLSAEDQQKAEIYAAWQVGMAARPRKKLEEIGKPFGITNPDRLRQLLREYAEPLDLPWTRNRRKP